MSSLSRPELGKNQWLRNIQYIGIGILAGAAFGYSFANLNADLWHYDFSKLCLAMSFASGAWGVYRSRADYRRS